ncbi:MAG: hypothetical protein LC100_00095 [Chitinophagales bacterium]|nr:hypothetical protein [Chitinophagales bacterium]
MSWIETLTNKLPPKWRWLWVAGFIAAAFLLMLAVHYSGVIFDNNNP